LASAQASLRQTLVSETSDRGHRAPTRSAGAKAAKLELRLLNGFEFLGDGEPVFFPMSAQRLLAFLALNERPLQRLYVAGKLWLDTTEGRAFANLRSTLWRANRSGHHLISVVSSQLALAPAVNVDVQEARGQARRLVEGAAEVDELSLDRNVLAGELLPDWYDDWVLIERERHRQLGLHALETLASRLVELGRFGEAADAALAAVASEPLRESAHRTLIGVHIAEGNVSEALRQYEVCRWLLNDRLGLKPSPKIDELVRGLTRR
jgi:DNA-binding SARP family transcriptional activator